MIVGKLISYFCCALKYAAAFVLAPFVKNKPQYNSLWIIAERGIDARDNAYHLFKYICRYHPEVNIAYIISKNSADRAEVEKLGRVIDYGSFEHYIAMVLSKVKISTHIVGYSPNINFFLRLNRYGLVNGKKVFLQHGIIKDNLTYLYYKNTRVDLFVCSAKAELEHISSLYGYPEGVVRMIGLCRYDGLEKKDTLTRRILLMPTWRFALRDYSEKEFRESRYYRAYQSLLNSAALAAFLEKYDFELIFYPHIEVHKYLYCFSGGCERVKVTGFKDCTVQSLLLESDVLITDFSSVFFDYGYMEKPVIYYQFDKEDFRKTHYGEGYFRYERDGFGSIAETEEELLKELERLAGNDFRIDDVYLERISSFFSVRDNNNCKRNFECIKEIAEDKK